MPRPWAVSLQRLGLDVADAGHDDQDAVGAERAGFVHLVRLVEEILAQHGEGDGGAGGDEIAGRALEEGRVGEHRQAGRAALGIGAGERRRVEIGADQALRRARLLDLGDERGAAGAGRRLDRGNEAAGRRRGAGAALHLGGRDGGLGGGDLGAFLGFDLVEDVGHGVSDCHPRESGDPVNDAEFLF